jgi:Glycosyl transferases group 1
VSPTIGILCPGDPTSRSTWSGIPRQIVDGLAERGLEVRGIDVDPPRPAVRWGSLLAGGAMLASVARSGTIPTPGRLRGVGSLSPAMAALRSEVAGRRIGESGSLDGLIQVGTGYTVVSGAPIVTIEDMTVVQAREVGAAWQGLSKRAFASRVARQRDAYARAKACCATTRWAATSIISDYGVPPEKVHVVGIGRNVEPKREGARREWCSPRFLFVGREWERKNGPRVVAAFARLRAERPDARLDVVGGHPPLCADGVVGHGLLALDDEGDRARLAALYAAATCFVMPSLHEPSAQAYVEASAWGVPSVVTENGGSVELVRDGGVVVDPLDDEGLLQAMRRLCDPVEAAQLGDIAERRSSLFTSGSLAGRLLRALDLTSIDPDALPEFVDETPLVRSR